MPAGQPLQHFRSRALRCESAGESARRHPDQGLCAKLTPPVPQVSGDCMSSMENRREQIFPVLDPSQMEIAKRFTDASPRTFAPGEAIFGMGERHAPAWLVLKGEIVIMRRDGLNREAQIAAMGVGQFTGE